MLRSKWSLTCLTSHPHQTLWFHCPPSWRTILTNLTSLHETHESLQTRATSRSNRKHLEPGSKLSERRKLPIKPEPLSERQLTNQTCTASCRSRKLGSYPSKVHACRPSIIVREVGMLRSLVSVASKDWADRENTLSATPPRQPQPASS